MCTNKGVMLFWNLLPGQVGRNYVCTFCGKESQKKTNIISHVRVHTGEKPFQCRVCHRFFSQSSNLRSHMITHIRPEDQKTWKFNIAVVTFLIDTYWVPSNKLLTVVMWMFFKLCYTQDFLCYDVFFAYTHEVITNIIIII